MTRFFTSSSSTGFALKGHGFRQHRRRAALQGRVNPLKLFRALAPEFASRVRTTFFRNLVSRKDSALRGIFFFAALLAALLISLTLPAHATAQSAKDLLGDGRVDEAISVLRQQTAQSPSAVREAEERNLLCRAYFMVEDWDHGIQECERAVALAPDNSVYHLWLGRIYGEKAERSGFLSAAGMAKKVRSEFERAVQLGPQNWEARSDLAEFYLEAPGIVGGGKDKALAQAEAMSAVNPAMAHYISGRIAEKNKDSASAEREYRTAIEVSQGGALAWLNLALFYRHENRFDDMEQALRVMQSRPLDRPESLLDGGAVLLRTNRDSKLGIELIRKYLSSTPVEQGPTFKAHYLLGELLEKQGDRQGAAEQYNAALSLAHEYRKADQALRRLER
jgi:tetratricopeptide (TPR) repeat protein